MTQWTITEDMVEEGRAVGTVGPCSATMTNKEIVAHPDRIRFRMYDDDGEFYYAGYMVGDENLFAPLDDFGTPNAGCTGIKIQDRAKGKFNWL